MPGNDEQQVSVPEVESPDVDVSPAVSESGADTSAAEISSEVQTLIDAEAAKVRESERLRYEGKGGKIAEIQSKYDRMLADERKQRRALQMARIQEAEELMAQDPSRGGQMALEQAKAAIEQQGQASQAEQIREWVQKEYEDYGANLEDEKVAAEAATAYDKLMAAAESSPDGGQAAAMEFQRELGQRLVMQAKEESTTLAKEMEDMKASIEGQIEAAVQRYLSGSGESRPDLSAPGRPSGGKTDYSKLPSGQNIMEGLAARRKAAQQK